MPVILGLIFFASGVYAHYQARKFHKESKKNFDEAMALLDRAEKLARSVEPFLSGSKYFK